MKKANTGTQQSATGRFHYPAIVASCALGSPEYSGPPKATCPSRWSGAVCSKVANPLCRQIIYHLMCNPMATDKENNRKPAGRKPKTDRATHRYGIKLNDDENARFTSLFLRSGMNEKAKFIKNMIFGNPMKTVKIDKAAMDYYIRLTNFYAQFQGIGNNYNQTVKAVKSNFSEKRALALLYKLEKATIELVVLSRKIIELTREFEERWLQK
jgi:hypothetical protein